MRNLLILFAVIVMTLAMSGCTTLLNEQAAAAAKDAENIARGCPAAAEKAAECREAAQAMETLQKNYLEFQSVGDGFADVRRQLADLQSQKDAIDVQIAHENYLTDERMESLQREARDYSHDAAIYRESEESDTLDPRSREDMGVVTDCSSSNDCSRKAAQNLLTLRDTPLLSDLNDRKDQINREIQRLNSQLHNLEYEYGRLYTEITGYEKNSEREMANQAPSRVQQRMTELNETAQQARAEAQRIAAEQCGEGAALQDAPPKPSLPSGDYPQDILNSQGMGLPSGPAPFACPISCAGITQAWCSSFCSVPIGPCAQCAFCAAQGCP